MLLDHFLEFFFHATGWFIPTHFLQFLLLLKEPPKEDNPPQ